MTVEDPRPRPQPGLHPQAGPHPPEPLPTPRAEPGVVVHLDEAGQDKHAAVLTNIANLLSELGDTTPVELVCHGPGVDLCLRGGPAGEQLEALIGRGVTVAACRNTMRGRGITPEQLASGVVVVPAGVGELVRKQRQGWAYLRP